MITIHGVPFSVHTRKAILAATLKQLPWRSEPVVPFFPPAGWRDLSPTGLIPVIEHDGFTLADSGAICAYFDRLEPEPPLYPRGARALGQTLWLDQYATAILFRTVVQPIFEQQIIKPNILKSGACDPAVVDALVREVAPPVFDYLDRRIAAEWMDGVTPSVALLAVASNLVNFQYLGHRLDRTRFPSLADTLDRCLGLPAFGVALDGEAAAVSQMGLDRSFLERS
jgi:glutathione S-transferase